MKKFFQSKGFIVSALAVLCVAILGVCWFVSRDRSEEFRPDESPPSSTSSDWSDGGVQSGDGSGGADAYAPGQSSGSEEEYPKVTSETDDEVVIDFTDTQKLPRPQCRRAKPSLKIPVKTTPSIPIRLCRKSRHRRRRNPPPAVSPPPAPATAAARCMTLCSAG